MTAHDGTQRNTQGVSKREYRIRQLGKALSGAAIQRLEEDMTSEGSRGWRFHSVISIVKTGGCLNTPQGTVYLAVYERTVATSPGQGARAVSTEDDFLDGVITE